VSLTRSVTGQSKVTEESDNIGGAGGNDRIWGYGGADRISGADGDDELHGGLGNDIFNGGAGRDLLDGGCGNDRFTGGAGSDRFFFGGGFGKDVITDFAAFGSAHDLIGFQKNVFGNYAGVRVAAEQVGSNVEITVDASNTITLVNVQLAKLDASDFYFV
jgi:Ca2+-binding RTX toxin-like protein